MNGRFLVDAVDRRERALGDAGHVIMLARPPPTQDFNYLPTF
jgi:hypothetical protein